MRLRGLVVAVGLATLVIGSVAWRWRDLEQKRFRNRLDEARQAFESGRPATARRLLRDLADRRPNSGEVLFHLGVCEKSLGNFDEAMRLWERVPRDSEFGARAASKLADELVNTGRYTPAESALLAVPSEAGPERYEVLRSLTRLYRYEGRTDDVRRLLRESIPLSPDPGADLGELWLLDNSPMPVEALGKALEHADDADDRVWLARANHAILTGRNDRARELLDACLKRRPDDPALWRSRLNLGVATWDLAMLREAMGHLPADALEESEVQELKARFLGWSGDREAERDAWEQLRKLRPGHARALERLASLAASEGRAREAEALNLAKAEIDRAKDRFRDLVLDAQPLDHAEELAQLAQRLGDEYEARAWNLLARKGLDGWATAAGGLLADANLKARGGKTPTLAARFPTLDTIVKARNPAPGATAATPPRFADVATASGLDFTFDNGASEQRLLPETMSGGVALLDFDDDGWLDVFVVQGGPLEDDPARPREPDRLFRNRGDGTFEDVTESSGIADLPRGYGLGATAGDFDNDGDADLFVTRLRCYALWRNRGDGTFEDVTEAAGLAGLRQNPTSAAFADLDGDGDLDLYVCHYMLYDPDHPVQCRNERGEFFYCSPNEAQPAADHLFRNDGGRFVDVTEAAGIVDRDGRGLGVVATDLDDDGRIDLYVANDGTANFLFHNLGDLRFEEIGLASGVAGAADGGYQASMGIACGDQDGDGRLDLIVTNFYGEGSTLYHNLGGTLFADWTGGTGLGQATRYLLGFGTAFLDYDDDGRLDLVTANGHVNDNRPYNLYAMPAQLLAGTPDARLVDVSAEAGVPWDVPRVGRGLAVGDLDHDGRQDVLILPQNSPLAYLRNATEGGSSIVLQLEATASNRDAVGARVTVEANGRRQSAERSGGGSYQSANSPRLHFGLGDAARAEVVEVRWPSGRADRFEGLGPGGYRIREGDPSPTPLPGYGSPGEATASDEFAP